MLHFWWDLWLSLCYWWRWLYLNIWGCFLIIKLYYKGVFKRLIDLIECYKIRVTDVTFLDISQLLLVCFEIIEEILFSEVNLYDSGRHLSRHDILWRFGKVWGSCYSCPCYHGDYCYNSKFHVFYSATTSAWGCVFMKSTSFMSCLVLCFESLH